MLKLVGNRNCPGQTKTWVDFLDKICIDYVFTICELGLCSQLKLVAVGLREMAKSSSSVAKLVRLKPCKVLKGYWVGCCAALQRKMLLNCLIQFPPIAVAVALVVK